VVVAATACAGTPARSHDATSRQTFEDVEHWTSVFDDPKRDDWQRPDVIVKALGLRRGMTVADLGAGTGYMSKRLSETVGPEGTVLAIEPEPKLLSYLRDRAEREQTANVIPILGSANDPRLPRGTADAVLVLDTFHHIDDRIRYFRDLRRSLKPGARVVVVDWHKRALPVGPPMDHKLAQEQVVEEMVAAGYRQADSPEPLAYHYIVVFLADGP
jgi:ubiquinone/menaquinone biosynthesis C-methylase UbiE